MVFTDLVGSTALRAVLGEERAEALRRAHDRTLKDVAGGGGGMVIKGLGDGFLIVYARAAEAVAGWNLRPPRSAAFPRRKPAPEESKLRPADRARLPKLGS